MTDWAAESFARMRQERQLDDKAEALIQRSIDYAQGYRMNHEPHYRARIILMAADMERTLRLPRNVAVEYALRFCVVDDLMLVGALDADRLGR